MPEQAVLEEWSGNRLGARFWSKRKAQPEKEFTQFTLIEYTTEEKNKTWFEYVLRWTWITKDNQIIDKYLNNQIIRVPFPLNDNNKFLSWIYDRYCVCMALKYVAKLIWRENDA